MKKIWLMLVAVALTANVFADEKSEALLGALQQKVAGWGDYRVEFSVTVAEQSLAGSYEVSGANYRIVTPEIELFCDGRIRYEVNLPADEVTIDRVDPDDRTVLGNPTRLFDFLDGTYTHRYVGTALINGVSCDRIELQEVGVKDGQKTDVFISTATGLPVRLSYTVGFMSSDAAIDVLKITPRITLDRASFTFDPARYKGFEIIDFR